MIKLKYPGPEFITLKYPGPEFITFSEILSRDINYQQERRSESEYAQSFEDQSQFTASSKTPLFILLVLLAEVEPELVKTSSPETVMKFLMLFSTVIKILSVFLEKPKEVKLKAIEAPSEKDLKADLQVKKDLLQETQKLNYENYLFGTHAFHEDTSLLSLLYIEACSKNPALQEKKDSSYHELLNDIFNTVEIACYVYVDCMLGIALKIIGSEQELQKIIDITSKVKAQTSDKKFFIGYFDNDCNPTRKSQSEINIGALSPEYLRMDKLVSGSYRAAFSDIATHERRSDVYRSPALKKLLELRGEIAPDSSYGQTMQLGISQFTQIPSGSEVTLSVTKEVGRPLFHNS